MSLSDVLCESVIIASFHQMECICVTIGAPQGVLMMRKQNECTNQISDRAPCRGGAPPSMSGGGWQEGEQGLPGLPDGHNRGAGPPPYSSDHGQGEVHRGGRGVYTEGQGDIQRFLEDVEASGKPRYI